jgi:hypothetical protein
MKIHSAFSVVIMLWLTGCSASPPVNLTLAPPPANPPTATRQALPSSTPTSIPPTSTPTAAPSPVLTATDAPPAAPTDETPQVSATEETWQPAATFLTKVAGVPIYYDTGEADFLPKDWRASPGNAFSQALSKEDAERVVPAMKEFVVPYGADVIQKNLKGVYVSGRINFFGKDAGGTMYDKYIYLVIGKEDQGYTKEASIVGLHHEFAHILFARYAFDGQVWQHINGDSFQYSENTIDMLGTENATHIDEGLLTKGFLDKYSTSSIYEDFAVYSQYIFTQNDTMCAYGYKYPQIAYKVAWVIKYYWDIDKTIQMLHCTPPG